MPPDGRHPPQIVRRWEELHVAVQVGITLPVTSMLLWFVHVTLLNQPTLRGLSYGIFWGVVATWIIVGATRYERAQRHAREQGTDRS